MRALQAPGAATPLRVGGRSSCGRSRAAGGARWPRRPEVPLPPRAEATSDRGEAATRGVALPSTSGREELTYSLFGLSRAEYDPAQPQGRYSEQPFDQLALWILCTVLADGIGEKLPPGQVTYDTFVDISNKIATGRSVQEQRLLVLGVLLNVIPKAIPPFFRQQLFPALRALGFPLNSAMAWGTAPFAGWLVGPSSWEYVDGADGASEPQRRKVKLKRCRYLEASGCKAQCVNLCKVPTQNFFTHELGLPLTMVPNFDDLSCELIYGQAPPPLDEDPAFRQPCFTTCAIAKAGDGAAAGAAAAAAAAAREGPPACRVVDGGDA